MPANQLFANADKKARKEYRERRQEYLKNREKLKNSDILNDIRDRIADTIQSKRRRNLLFDRFLGDMVDSFSAFIAARRLEEHRAKEYLRKLKNDSKLLSKGLVAKKECKTDFARQIFKNIQSLQIKQKVMEYYIKEQILEGHRHKESEKDLLIIRLDYLFNAAKIKNKLGIIANLFTFFRVSNAFCIITETEISRPAGYKNGKNSIFSKSLTALEKYKKGKCRFWKEDKKECIYKDMCSKEYDNIKKRISRIRRSKETHSSLVEIIKDLNKRDQLDLYGLLKQLYPRLCDDKIRRVTIELLSDSEFSSNFPLLLPSQRK